MVVADHCALTGQLPLRPRFSVLLDSFVSGDNQQLLDVLSRLGPGADWLYLWGGSGLGKSHLLEGCCNAAVAMGRRAVYLPLAEWLAAGPDILQATHGYDLICVDDLQLVTAHPDWQEALFHFYNDQREQQGLVVFAANQPPQQLGLSLADLRSRLQACAVYQLQAVPDVALDALIEAWAAGRGVHIEQRVRQYILDYYPRDHRQLIQQLEQLKYGAQALKRPLTIPLLRQLLEQTQ